VAQGSLAGPATLRGAGTHLARSPRAERGQRRDDWRRETGSGVSSPAALAPGWYWGGVGQGGEG
jgi:hypothetical protein